MVTPPRMQTRWCSWAIVQRVLISALLLTVGLGPLSQAWAQMGSAVPPLILFPDGHWVVDKDFEYFVPGLGIQVVVPAGFVTDLASIPPPLNLFFTKNRSYEFAAIIHDYLYWKQEMCKGDADRIFEMAMLNFGMSRKEAKFMYWAVLTPLGEKAWKGNAEDRRRGRPRIIPREYRSRLQIGVPWHPWNGPPPHVGFRRQLVTEWGVRVDHTRGRPKIC
jgi:hypothetical protein